MNNPCGNNKLDGDGVMLLAMDSNQGHEKTLITDGVAGGVVCMICMTLLLITTYNIHIFTYTLHAKRGHVPSTLQLLCFGAAIDDKALEYDKTALLRPIKDRLKSLRDMKNTTLMSDEERHFMIHVTWFLDRKCPEATFKAYYAIRSFITFHGIFMGLEYSLGAASIWYLDKKKW